MTDTSIEDRITTLEAEVASLKRRLDQEVAESPAPWWEAIFGTFADSPEYDDAMRLGREYRESLRLSKRSDAG